ncbi:pantetheine-phosphate adenylyltransferase [Demequina aurantiaca]|uniref:pantetheine-phosphate adenylyltransferase n=1 Tax=Demequina aurantiaca TaxID=676200 RepID=UPI000783F955|nr:pantetheine-phosphate adenylyltransferase [Demequina aurantiaca]
MTIAVFPGTFDPITLGHVDIAVRARKLFDEVIIGVAHNSSKSPLLNAEARLDIASAVVAPIDGVRVEIVDGLLAQFCEERGVGVIVKGLRGGADYDAELPMALMNRSLTGIESIFIVGDSSLSHVASSLVRDVARHGGDISGYVPDGVVPVVADALSRQ